MSDLKWNLQKIGEVTEGTLIGESNPAIRNVVTDSRQDVKGALYIALKGENFDGHDFLDHAAKGGAAALLVEKPATGLSVPQIVVSDTYEALQALGLARRSEFFGPLVAITGSSGKTTTRRLLVSILENRFVTHQPIRNFNNHVGVPLTLLNLESTHEATVLELGCSDFGEIATLAKCANPDFALITNVGPAHLERLKDLEGVARAKGELFLSIRKDAVALVNLDDPRISSMPVHAQRVVTFGTQKEADVRLVQTTPAGVRGQTVVFDIRGEKVTSTLPLLGAHNAVNALAAAAAAIAVGLGSKEIIAGLLAVTPEPGRLVLKKGRKGAYVIDDTYNANPASMRAAIAVLKEISEGGRSIAVIGDMLELGEHTKEAHINLGRYIAQTEIDLLITLGKEGTLIGDGAIRIGLPAKRCLAATDHAEAADLVEEYISGGDTVLVKGSRSMKMETIVADLTRRDK